MKDQELLEQLESLLRWKKSKQFYSEKLGISLEQVDDLLEEIRGSKPSKPDSTEESVIKHNVEKNSIEVVAYYDTPPTSDQIIKDHNIDTNKYKLSTFWTKLKTKGYQVSAFFTAVPQKDTYKREFISYLKSMNFKAEPVQKVLSKEERKQKNACLIINKQDAHLNKYDINGDNDIEQRFFNIEYSIEKMLKKAKLSSNLNKVIYIIGSDEFDSEFTGATTGGTPQKALLPYHQSFEAICKHEINIINLMLAYSDNLEVIYVPGNHDEYVGWHLISWLDAYFSKQANVTFDTNPDYTKYIKYYDTGIMLNHGYSVKPERLAQNFPIEFKEHWSSCNHYYIFTGDKHHEISRSIGGIKFFQIPALSKAKSSWDSRNGYTTSPVELTGFVIVEDSGMSDIYKETL